MVNYEFDAKCFDCATSSYRLSIIKARKEKQSATEAGMFSKF